MGLIVMSRRARQTLQGKKKPTTKTCHENVTEEALVLVLI